MVGKVIVLFLKHDSTSQNFMNIYFFIPDPFSFLDMLIIAQVRVVRPRFS
jgi:hypothetical protein